MASSDLAVVFETLAKFSPGAELVLFVKDGRSCVRVMIRGTFIVAEACDLDPDVAVRKLRKELIGQFETITDLLSR